MIFFVESVSEAKISNSRESIPNSSLAFSQCSLALASSYSKTLPADLVKSVLSDGLKVMPSGTRPVEAIEPSPKIDVTKASRSMAYEIALRKFSLRNGDFSSR